jgi:hypothetical protein
MQLADFERMVQRMVEEIPADYFEGITGIEVSARAVPHPTREGVYTMGECIPIDVGADSGASRVVLYYGSFHALAGDRAGFDWRAEAWETVTHELRHHLEWKANAQDLENYDWAAEQSFARSDEDAFDPVFFLEGERVAPDTYQVDDDVFFDRIVRDPPESVEVTWKGRRYRVPVPDAPFPLYLALEGLVDGPAGDAILVIRRKPRVLDLFRAKPRPTERSVHAEMIANDPLGP